jgi:hypothetical protein
MTKKTLMHWGKFNIFFEISYKFFYEKIHLHVKVIFGKRTQFFFQSNPFGKIVIGFDLSHLS